MLLKFLPTFIDLETSMHQGYLVFIKLRYTRTQNPLLLHRYHRITHWWSKNIKFSHFDDTPD